MVKHYSSTNPKLYGIISYIIAIVTTGIFLLTNNLYAQLDSIPGCSAMWSYTGPTGVVPDNDSYW